MLVLDASAAAELILARDGSDGIAAAIAEHDYDLHAPHLLDIEVISALRRLTATRKASAERAAEALDDLADLPITRYPHDILLNRVWELRANFSSYDGAYVALAEALTEEGAALLTSDAGLARAARRHTGVEVLLAGSR